MFRIIATVNPGHDMDTVVFTVRAANVTLALGRARKAMNQLGFKSEDYRLAYSNNLL